VSAPIPVWVIEILDELNRSGWTGKVGLNVRDGQIIEVEQTSKRRAPSVQKV